MGIVFAVRNYSMTSTGTTHTSYLSTNWVGICFPIEHGVTCHGSVYWLLRFYVLTTMAPLASFFQHAGLIKAGYFDTNARENKDLRRSSASYWGGITMSLKWTQNSTKSVALYSSFHGFNICPNRNNIRVQVLKAFDIVKAVIPLPLYSLPEGLLISRCSRPCGLGTFTMRFALNEAHPLFNPDL